MQAQKGSGTSRWAGGGCAAGNRRLRWLRLHAGPGLPRRRPPSCVSPPCHCLQRRRRHSGRRRRVPLRQLAGAVGTRLALPFFSVCARLLANVPRCRPGPATVPRAAAEPLATRHLICRAAMTTQGLTRTGRPAPPTTSSPRCACGRSPARAPWWTTLVSGGCPALPVLLHTGRGTCSQPAACSGAGAAAPPPRRVPARLPPPHAAVNAVSAYCKDGTELTPHPGYFGEPARLPVPLACCHSRTQLLSACLAKNTAGASAVGDNPRAARAAPLQANGWPGPPARARAMCVASSSRCGAAQRDAEVGGRASFTGAAC